MYNWKSVILKPDDIMETAIEVLDRESLRIVMVADNQGRLVGTITDGDIRRALIQHCGMGTRLDSIMFKEPTTALSTDASATIRKMMIHKDLLQVPLVDRDRIIVGLETLQNLLTKEKQLENPVFLMAGGFGKRLMPLTTDIPKPLLKVGSKPILETILGQFIDVGFCNFYISTHYKADLVREHFGDGSHWGINIHYVHEDEPLGTAGALGLLPSNLPDLPVIIMNGDLLTKVNYMELLNYHNDQGGIATMCVREYDLQVPYGVVKANNQRIIDIVEKPVHSFFVNAGIYVLNPSLIGQVKCNEYIDMPTLLQSQIDKNEIINMFPVHEYWLDIGQVEEYEKAQIDVSRYF
jgi:dTDP-glucose pyrophosphorylase